MRRHQGTGNSSRKPQVSDAKANSENAYLQLDINEKGKGEALVTTQVRFRQMENKASHRTLDYESMALIVRRGQEFLLTVDFEQPLDEKDEIVIQVTTGSRPSLLKQTLIRFSTSDTDQSVDGWRVKRLGEPSLVKDLPPQTGGMVDLSITSPSDAIVGPYQLYVETWRTKGEDQANRFPHRFRHEDMFFLLFNAWCKEDDVYLEKEEERQEFVLEDTGRIFTMAPTYSRSWNYGQFEEVCFRAVMFLMDSTDPRRERLPAPRRSDPVEVCRFMSALANSNNADGGVLEGCWDETFPRGTTNPTAWSGSVKILEEFMLIKSTVKFGQCWVFAGLLTTLLRALGIPTRPVTCFDSAHDSDGSLSIDKDFHNGRSNMMGHDSIWNYHVWNEVWMKRRDLPEGYDGWQALDATPQEESNGVMRCGPASVTAVKEGHVYLSHDTEFVFTEVNGDIWYWLDGQFYYREMNKIGSSVVTKGVSVDDGVNVVSNYRHPEGTQDYSRMMAAALKHSKRYKVRSQIKKDFKQDDSIEASLSLPDKLQFGNKVTIKLKLGNTSAKPLNAEVVICPRITFYTGTQSHELKHKDVNIEVPKASEKEVTMVLTPDQYLNKTLDNCFLNVMATVSVKETGQKLFKDKTIPVEIPGLVLTLNSANVQVNTPFQVQVEIKNPTEESLTHGVLLIEGARCKRAGRVDVEQIEAKGSIIKTVQMEAKKAGARKLVATYESPILKGLTGSATITVN